MKSIRAFIKRVPLKSHTLKGLLSRSPVLFRGLAIVPIVAACYSLRNAVALSVVMAFVLLPTVVLLSSVRTLIWTPMRLPTAALVAFVFYLPGWQVATSLVPGVADRLGIYLPLVLVDTLLLSNAEDVAFCKPLRITVRESILDWIGFVLVALLTGFVREIIGLGTLWGNPIPFPLTTTIAVLPAGGFIVLGLLAAGWRLCGHLGRYLFIRYTVHHGGVKRKHRHEEVEG